MENEIKWPWWITEEDLRERKPNILSYRLASKRLYFYPPVKLKRFQDFVNQGVGIIAYVNEDYEAIYCQLDFDMTKTALILSFEETFKHDITQMPCETEEFRQIGLVSDYDWENRC